MEGFSLNRTDFCPNSLDSQNLPLKVLFSYSTSNLYVSFPPLLNKKFFCLLSGRYRVYELTTVILSLVVCRRGSTELVYSEREDN